MQKTTLSIILGILCPLFLTAQASVYYRHPTFDNKGNTAFGLALGQNGGTYNVGVGLNALSVNITGVQNTSVGTDALRFNTTGERNVAVGTSALHNNNGSYNVALGFVALISNTIGGSNTAIGAGALHGNTTGDGNTATGFEALHDNISGRHNVATGWAALRANTIGGGNVANGIHALYDNTVGYFNTAHGYLALRFNTTGEHNVADGFQALKTNISGHRNTAIGSEADVAYSYLTNATAIGAGAKVIWHNRVRIGNTNVTQIGGQVNWSVFSDARLKSNVKNSELGLKFINQLRPVTYHYKYDSTETVYTGFIAQEVEAAATASGHKDFSAISKPQHAEDHYSLRYAEFVVPLVKAVQEQQQIIQTQKDKISTLEQRLKALEAFVKMPVDNANRSIELKQNRPNPANGQAQIDYFIPESANKVILALYDISGKQLQAHSISTTGEGSMILETKNLAAGTYIYTLRMDGKEAISKKMMVAAE